MDRKQWQRVRSVVTLAVLLFGYSVVPDRDFDAWQVRFRQLALSQGIEAATLDNALFGLLPDRKVLRLSRSQPEFQKTVSQYLQSAVSEQRIAAGQQRWYAYRDLLTVLYEIYGVQPEYLLAIWGLESDFGQFTGRYSIIRSLATLAYAGSPERRDFWQEQLLAALRIVQRGDLPLVALRGSWAGAVGHTQFIPTTFEAYAVDFDGDGKRDPVNSVADALASAANYLSRSGWERGKPWGMEVRLPPGFDWSRADPSFWLPADVWATESCLVQADGRWLAGTESAFLLLPAGYRGPAFLAFRNFNVILRYNNAQSYALAVGYLGDRIRGGAPLVTAWPQDEQPLNQTQKAQLQELLTAAGYSTDGVDGRIGPNTRAALRRWQMDVGFPADGYATLQHLEFLQREVAGTFPAQ